jgi:hypothetical protein
VTAWLEPPDQPYNHSRCSKQDDDPGQPAQSPGRVRVAASQQEDPSGYEDGAAYDKRST